MLKILKLLLLLSLLGGSLVKAQENACKVVPILSEQSFYLNSKTRVGGKSRNSLKIDLPPNTVAWHYAVTTLPNEQAQNSSNQLGLIKALVKNIANYNAVGVATNLAYQIVKPTGAEVCDIYLTDANGLGYFYEKDALGFYKYENTSSYKEGTRENFKDGVVTIKEVTTGSVYLCFKNPSPLEGITIIIEVAAIVKEENKIDEWTSFRKQTLYEALYNKFLEKGILDYFTEKEVKNLTQCMVTKLINAYSPQKWENLATFEREIKGKEIMQSCVKELGMSQNPVKRVK